MTHPSRQTEGFTLVEVLTVVALASIIMSIALPTIDVDRFRMNGEVRSLTMFVNTAQRTAIWKQHDVVLAFLTDRGEVRMHYDEDNDGQVDTGEETRTVRLSDEVVFNRGGATKLSSSEAFVTFTEKQDGHPSVTFRRNGSASQEGIVYITSLRGTRVSRFKHHARAIEIERATAQVSCWSFATESWSLEC